MLPDSLVLLAEKLRQKQGNPRLKIPHTPTFLANLLGQNTSLLRPAAVLIPLILRDKGLFLLLTQRALHLTHHAGQVSFPGGRLENHEIENSDFVGAALRESWEEIGLLPAKVQILGHLDEHPTISRYRVRPVVGVILGEDLPNLTQLTWDKGEVETAFEVPLTHFTPTNRQRVTVRPQGFAFETDAWLWDDQVIWGATANILENFLEYWCE